MTDAARRYTEELVYTSTDDGLLLEGVVVRPRGTAGTRSLETEYKVDRPPFVRVRVIR